MRILLDECMPRPLANAVQGHEVLTVAEMGWMGKKNGELMALMVNAGFNALVTVDQSLRHQQNVKAHGLAVVVMSAPSNRFADLLPLVSQLEHALNRIAKGEVVEIVAPLSSE